MKISVDYEKLIEVLGNVSCLNCPMAEKCNKEANNIPMVMKADDPSVCAKYILDNWLLEGNPLEWTRIMREAVPSITAANQSTLPEGYHPYPQEIPTETYKRYKVVLKNGDEVETTFKRTNFTRKEVVGWKW